VHFDLTDLRLFAAVVEEGSITAGASRAAISLPSASARVKGMEEALGTALLERHRRGVRPTPAGAALCHHAQLVLAQMERLRGDLREHARGGVRGHVRLMSNTTALEEYLPDVLAGWLARNPGVDIALEERVSHEIAPAVARAHADIGVLTDLAGAEGLETYPFRIDRLVVVVPRGHALEPQRDIALPMCSMRSLSGSRPGVRLPSISHGSQRVSAGPSNCAFGFAGWMLFVAWWSAVWGLPSCQKPPPTAVGEPWHSVHCGSRIVGPPDGLLCVSAA
jgi:molybdate transport repressor ModE-like protein